MRLCVECGTGNDDGATVCAYCASPIQAARPDPLVGRTIGGAYLIQELIGIGGMGRVYRAEQTTLGRTVAIKVVHPHLLGDEETAARFYNEARAASRLNHPDSVSIIDFGRTEDGVLYLVMEHLDGRDLALILADEGPLPFSRISRICRHVLSALGEAHSLGVVHRDLKPENVIIRPVRRGEEQIKVVDFGLAHIVGPGGTSITTPGLICGTPDYMSPEQGRGEEVDGRGDLYAIGVLLFEMLTDRLPFEGETPTKVVLQHINDPVPDPREMAPHRAIPELLADICLKALRKDREERYQTADAMYEALAAAQAALDARKVSPSATCPSCRQPVASNVSFCGKCGGALKDRFTIPPSFISAPPHALGEDPPSLPDIPLVGREKELDRLLSWAHQAREAPLWVRLEGEPGVGKTRLLREFSDRLQGLGDVVAQAEPHCSREPVPYFAVIRLICNLLELPEDGLGRLIVDDRVVGDPVARAGVEELLVVVGAAPDLSAIPDGGRAQAVAQALRRVLRVAAERATSGRVALLVDDLEHCDYLSRRVLQALFEGEPSDPFMLVTTSAHEGSDREGGSAVLRLAGVPRALATDLLTLPSAKEFEVELDLQSDEVSLAMHEPVPASSRTGMPQLHQASPGLGSEAYLPLYLVQLRAIGISSLDAEGTLPRLSDAVSQRVEGLSMKARRLLQVISVLGVRAHLEQVRGVAREADLQALEELTSAQLIEEDTPGIVRVAHPLVRDLVEASIPAEHRRQLHSQALGVLADRGAPLEIRAGHAFRAEEPFGALLLLERMGTMALHRGDNQAAVLAFRRGLEVARKELLLNGDTSFDAAIVTFSRCLGDAMDQAGHHASADGVLREALALAGSTNRERPRMLRLLSRVAIRRGRPRDATRWLGQALELSSSKGDREGEAQAHLALGRLRLEDGDARTALTTLERAVKIAMNLPNAARLRVEANLAHAAAHRELDELSEASRHLMVAAEVASGLDTPYWSAQVRAAMADLASLEGDGEKAVDLFREASRLAAAAGDLEGSRRFHSLASSAVG